MKLQSGNPDGFVFVFGIKSLTKGASEYRSVVLSLFSSIETSLNFSQQPEGHSIRVPLFYPETLLSKALQAYN
jgi:hypothetical protein